MEYRNDCVSRNIDHSEIRRGGIADTIARTHGNVIEATLQTNAANRPGLCAAGRAAAAPVIDPSDFCDSGVISGTSSQVERSIGGAITVQRSWGADDDGWISAVQT